MARRRRCSSRMSPMNQRSRGSLSNICRASYCLSSSRLKITTRFGSWLASSSVMKALPNEPVPPVTRIDEPVSSDMWPPWAARTKGALMRAPAVRLPSAGRDNRTAETPSRRTMRVNAVIQARAGSTRLPGKVLEPLGSLTVLEWVIRAARGARLVDDVVVATTVEALDDAVARAAEEAGALVVRGSEDDVLSRYLLAAEEHPCDAVVRLTSDCPMLDPEVIDLVVSTWLGAPHLDYVSSVLVRTLPHGMDVELATTDALHRAGAVATAHHRTHVTSAI